MADNGQETVNQARAGMLSLTEIRSEFETATASAVTIEDWGVCYNSGTGQLSEFCTAVATNAANPITGIGMIAYSANGSVMYAVQYSNGFSSPMIATSIGTTLYNPQDGNQVLCVVYGWTEQSSYYFTKTITVGNCD
jgi:hypothetical protein